jgi:hypothetical protein
LALTGVATFLAGMIIGVGLMWMLQSSRSADTEPSASASAVAEVPSAEPTASASASEPTKPTVDPAVAARARRLAELRKKVKPVRSSQLDAQCGRFKEGFNKGYIYDGGTFAENEFVANSAGCVALAKTRKAPWFCCKK